MKRNLARADEISTDERKMRQELERELDRLKTDYSKLGDHRLVEHRVASDDLVVLREQIQALREERDQALFKATQYEIRYGVDHGHTPQTSERSGTSAAGRQRDEEMILLLAENAQRDEELISRLLSTLQFSPPSPLALHVCLRPSSSLPAPNFPLHSLGIVQDT